MKIKMDEWDNKIVPFLLGIQMRSRFIQNDINHIAELCDLLEKRPSWETDAHDALLTTISQMEDQLNRLKEAEKSYTNKPTGE